MRRITFLSVLFLLIGWGHTWAQTLVSDVTSLTDGTIVALQCRDTNGGTNYYFNGNAVKSSTLSYSNLFKIVTKTGDGFALQRVMDETYIGKNGDDLAIVDNLNDASSFTVSIATISGWENTMVEGTANGTSTIRFTTDGTYLNTQQYNLVPKYTTGTGGYSVWYVYSFQAEDIVPRLQEIYNVVEAEIGTDPGYIASTTDVETAKSMLDNMASAEVVNKPTKEELCGQITKLYNVWNTRIMPESGKCYMIINAYSGFETNQNVKKVMYSDGSALKWETLNEDDWAQYWTLEPLSGEGYTLRNYGDKKYPQRGFTVGTDATVVTTLEFLGVAGQFKIKIAEQPAHTGGHDNGDGVSGSIINYDNVANTASAWYIHEVEKPEDEVLTNATIQYTVDGVVKKTIMTDYDTENPESVAIDFVIMGAPIIDDENNTVTIPCIYDLPFTASTDFETATWYVVDMHCQDTGDSDISNGTSRYIWTFVGEDEEVELPKVSTTEVESGYMPDECRWAFVGNPFDGFKIYNKAAGEGLTLRKAAIENMPVVMSSTNDNNVFFLHATTSGIANSFAWQRAGDTYYVNAQTENDMKVLRGWNAAGSGSSCRVFVPFTDIPTKAFYRLKGVANSLYLTTGDVDSRMPMVTEGTGAASIFYYDGDRRLLNYGNGLCAYHTSETGAVGNASTWGVHVSGSHYILEANQISGYGRYLYNHNAGSEEQANRNSVLAGNNTLWTVEEVTELPVTISSALWATFSSPVALTIPEGVTAYYAKSLDDDGNVVMEALTGTVLPVGLPVLLSAETADTYMFGIGGTAELPADANSQLKGTEAGKINVADDRTTYVLALLDGRVAFGRNKTGVVPGFKAYLEPEGDAAEATSFSIRFDEFVTGIQGVTVREADKATEYYDLSGRRVYFPTKGFYVTNRGEKVFIK